MAAVGVGVGAVTSGVVTSSAITGAHSAAARAKAVSRENRRFMVGLYLQIL